MPLKIVVDDGGPACGNGAGKELEPPWTVRKPGVTEDEYLEMAGEDDRWELIDGEVIVNSPAFTPHEDLDRWILWVVGGYVEMKGLGKVYPSNEMVHLATGRILVPDLSFLSRARAGQETEKWVEAPVDWVCEIASPSSLRYDLGEKLNLYKEHAIGEVWVIDPEARRVHVVEAASSRLGMVEAASSRLDAKDGRPACAAERSSEAGSYEDRVVEHGRVESSAIEGFWLDAGWLWERPLPGGLASLKTILGVERI